MRTEKKKKQKTKNKTTTTTNGKETEKSRDYSKRKEVCSSLWTFMLQAFGILWVMPGSVAVLLSCWYQWHEKHNSDIWNLVPGCLMWIVWLERNRWSFEDKKKTLDELKLLCHRSLLEWSRCWGFTDCSFLSEFLSSLSLVSWFPSLFIIMNFLYFLFFYHL